MKKSLYTKTIKSIQTWTGKEATKIDTSKFRYPNDYAYDIQDKTLEDWHLRIDYSCTDEWGNNKPVKDRTINFYLTDKRKDVEIHRSIYLYANDEDARYTHRAQVDVRANNVPVAYNFVDIDLYDYEGKFTDNFADTICGLIFRP